MRNVIVFVFLLVNYISWSQREFPVWSFRVNDQEMNTVLWKNFSNILEIDGKKASKMVISSDKAKIHRVGDKFVLVPNEGVKEVKILFSYHKRKKNIALGVMIFQVE